MQLPLRTPEEMHDYCVKNDCGWGMTRIWATKHFELIVNSLNPDERFALFSLAYITLKTLATTTSITPSQLPIRDSSWRRRGCSEKR